MLVEEKVELGIVTVASGSDKAGTVSSDKGSRGEVGGVITFGMYGAGTTTSENKNGSEGRAAVTIASGCSDTKTVTIAVGSTSNNDGGRTVTITSGAGNTETV